MNISKSKHSNRIIAKFFLLFICLSFIMSFPVPVKAQEAFIINKYNVDIRSNLDNSFNFTETISMNFSEDRHGILRAIPKKGGSQRYTISNIDVKDETFSLESDSLNMVIRIGDANTTFNGDKTYVITYTLSFNKDNDPTQDIVNLDLIGNMWDTQINNATINFYFPTKTSIPDKYQVFSGVYGSKDETATTVKLNSDHLTITNNSELSNFEGISLYAKFPDNTFSQAKDLPEPFQLNNYNATIDIKKDRVVHYKETFDLKINDLSEPAYYNLPLYTQDNASLSVRDVVLNGLKLTISDIQGVFQIRMADEGPNILTYTIIYKDDDDTSIDNLQLMLFSNYREVTLVNPKITINSQFMEPTSYQTMVAITKAEATSDVIQNTQGKTIQIDIKTPLQTGEGIYIDLEYPEGSFGFLLAPFTVISILLGILLLLLSVFWFQKYGKDDVVSPVIEFYPPDGLSSAAIGFIGNRLVNPIDITSMLLYWASHNHIHFLATSKTDFILSMNTDMDDLHPQWEQKAFIVLRDLILKADNSLSKDELQKNFYKIAEKIKPAIPLYFKNEKSLDDKKSSRMSTLLSIISALWMGIFAGIIVVNGIDPSLPALIAGIVAFIIPLIYFGLFRGLSNGWHKRGKPGNFSLTVFYALIGLISIIGAISVSLVIETTVQLPAILFTLIAVIISQVIAVFTIKRSVYGQQILERVIGFKEFLKIAEKERLEALLEDNPEYYYQILPYALVLDVSNIWEAKFKDLQMVEPSWYQGGYPGYMFSYAALSTFAHTTSTSLSHYTAPPSSSGTGGFSGGGGGGFSGGGGGGGGGSSW